MSHLAPVLRDRSEADLIELMDACQLVSRIASMRPADSWVSEWVDTLGDLCSEEVDRRRRAAEFHAQELRTGRACPAPDPLMAALFGGVR